MSEGLSIISKFSGQLKDVSLVEVKGLIDGSTNNHFKQELMALLEKNIKMIVLDLQAVEYINSAGLGTIMEVRNRLEETRGLVVIVGAGGKVKKVMDMVGFPSVLPMAESLKEAKSILEKFMLKREAEDTGQAVARFPLTINCSCCHAPFDVSKSGPVKCPSCGELLHVEDSGRIFSLTPHDYKKERGVSGVVELSSDLRLLRLLRQFASGFCREHGFKDNELEDIELAIDEASTNIVEHAYNRDPSSLIKMQLEAFEDRMVILLIDNGKSFDSSKRPIPEPNERVKQGHVSGLGRYFMYTTMDEVNYVSVPGVSNTLKMVKYRPGFKPVTEALNAAAADGVTPAQARADAAMATGGRASSAPSFDVTAEADPAAPAGEPPSSAGDFSISRPFDGGLGLKPEF